MISFKELLMEIKNYDKSGMRKLVITSISNITIEPFLSPFLEKIFYQNGINQILSAVASGEYRAEYFKEMISNSDIILVWLNFDSLFEDIRNKIFSEQVEQKVFTTQVVEMCKSIFEYIKGLTSAQVIWVGFEDYDNPIYSVTGKNYFCNVMIDLINIEVGKALTNEVVMLDLKHIIASVGIINAFDLKLKYRWSCPYSKEVMAVMSDEILKQYQIMNYQTKKCVVLDCDNVLWGGILSEGGVENICLGTIGLGRFYKDFQRCILSLYYMGIILTVCSKNDLEDVLSVFRLHSEMVLKEEHISAFQVSWTNKADGIKKLSETLNIGLDSMVFIDDSYIELESVRSIIPEVTCKTFNSNDDIGNLLCFNLGGKIDIQKVRQRNETFKSNCDRKRLEGSFENYDDFVKSLDILVSIQKADLVEYNRLSELSQRTNKCTNGKRYTVSHIKKNAYDEYWLYSVYVKDKFSDLGIVGVIGVDQNKLDLFCLSCRALGRGIEHIMLKFVQKTHKISHYDFFETGKNGDLVNKIKNIITVEE